jgi:hypothetical protein
LEILLVRSFDSMLVVSESIVVFLSYPSSH